jgi:GNAT superfamily N-acetyltransferase
MLIRKLHTEEKGLYADHLKRLPPSDRSSRFSEAAVSDELIDKYVAGISDDDLLMGAFIDHVMIGAVHVGLGGAIAEIGISVEGDHRGQNVGAELMDHAAQWSRNRHAERLYIMCSDSNQSMQALARSAGMRITHDHGVAEGTMDLDPPNVLTYSDEIAADVKEVWHDWAHMFEHVQELWFGTLTSQGAKSSHRDAA